VKLPNFGHAVVPQEKITKYLLSPVHPRGRWKAQFFKNVGFSRVERDALVAALLQHVADHQVKKVEDSHFGIRYTVEGAMEAPDGRAPVVRSIWFIRTGDTVPRLVTAYPLERSRE